MARAEASQDEGHLCTDDGGGIIHPRQHLAGDVSLCGQPVCVKIGTPVCLRSSQIGRSYTRGKNK